MQIIRISAVPERCETPKSTVRRTVLDGHCAEMGNETCQQVTRWWIITEFTGLNWKWFITGQDRCQMKFAWGTWRINIYFQLKRGRLIKIYCVLWTDMCNVHYIYKVEELYKTSLWSIKKIHKSNKWNLRLHFVSIEKIGNTVRYNKRIHSIPKRLCF